MSEDQGDPRIMTGAAWTALLEALERSRRLVHGEGVPDSPRDRAEGARYLTRLLRAGITICVEHADADYPQFGRFVDLTMPWGLDCPDCLYLYATVRGDATYRLWGNRGSANHIDIQMNYGHFASGSIGAWGTVSSINGLELETDANGNFELYIGGQERPGNWRPLAGNAEFVLVRQYFNDWERERPADLYIERVGAQGPPPPPTTEQIAARFERLIEWVEKSGSLWEKMSRDALALPPNTLNVFRSEDSDKRAGLRGQAYGLGNFRCAAGQAVIIELTPPRCHHWSLALANWYWESLDFAARQTSLNGHQARAGSDGVVRVVVAHEDPGVPNWLDTSGYTEGTLAARFLLAESGVEITSNVLPFTEIRGALPADTPRVTREERAQQLERRRHAVLRRYRM